MKKLLVIGLVVVLALSLGAGAVFAGAGEGDAPSPSILVNKVAEAVVGGVISIINVTNTGLVNATLTNVTDTVYYQEDEAAEWIQLAQNVDETGYEIAVDDETLELVYTIDCEVPEDAVLLKNVVLVDVEGTDEVFEASVTFLPYVDEEEPEDDDDVVDKKKGVERHAFRSGKSHCWHFRMGDGPSGRLNCQIKDGKLKGVFNGKGLEPGVEYCLFYEGTCLGSAKANKAGKVHIKAACQGVEEPTLDNLSLEPCETE